MAPVIRLSGWMIGGLLVLLPVADWALRRFGRTPRMLERLSLGGRVGVLVVGVAIMYGGDRFGKQLEAAFIESSVVVTAHPPADPFFPIEFVIRNDFQTMTNVRVSCVVSQFWTDSVHLSDTEALNLTTEPTMASGAQRTFQCPAPPDLSPPFRLGDVRGAHVAVDVLFSTPDRWRQLGVRQVFDLVDGKDRGPFWQAGAPVLMR